MSCAIADIISTRLCDCFQLLSAETIGLCTLTKDWNICLLLRDVPASAVNWRRFTTKQKMTLPRISYTKPGVTKGEAIIKSLRFLRR